MANWEISVSKKRQLKISFDSKRISLQSYLKVLVHFAIIQISDQMYRPKKKS